MLEFAAREQSAANGVITIVFVVFVQLTGKGGRGGLNQKISVQTAHE